jgi:PAS domain S-box-containing protein/putative nucleotidyltransferase with HDIG domain
MKYENKTKEQLIKECIELSRRIVEQEKHFKGVDEEFKEFKKASASRDQELRSISMELAISLSEVFEALKKLSSGDPDVRISEKSEVELIALLKRRVNLTAKNIREMVDQCHEFAISLCEHFDVLKRVSAGDLGARVSGIKCGNELLDVLKDVTNKTIDSLERERAKRKRYEKDIERLRRHHELILNSAGEGILGLDIQGNHTFVNPAAAEMLGWEVNDLLGKHSHSTWHHTKADGTLYPAEECPIYSVYKDGAVHYMAEEVFWSKDGTSFPAECTSTPIVEEGKIIGAVVNFREVTERKRRNEQIQSHLRHLEALRDIDRAITNSLDVKITLKVVLEEVTRQLQVSAADVLLFKPHLKMLEYAAGLGFRTAALQYTGPKLGHGYAGLAALERRIIEIPELSKAEGEFTHAPLLKTEGFVTYFAVPLISKGQIKGVLEIFHRSLLKVDREWLGFLESLAIQAAIAIDNAELFNDLQRSNLDLALAYDATIEGWSSALDMRDKETEGHSQRVTEMTVRIAQAMGISEVDLVHVRRGALLHDIGKMGIPDSILNKHDKLTHEEHEIMQKHPLFAFEMLSQIGFLRPAMDIPYCHHEKWDGTGYPRGLKGKQIPLAARIFAVVDVWDALCSNRPYRPAWSKEKARAHINQEAGVHFDPKVVAIFLKMEMG